MYRALVEWPGQECVYVLPFPGPIILLDDFPSVFCIAGAGRGPLISRCLSAIERAQRDAVVYAVEKNPNAFVT